MNEQKKRDIASASEIWLDTNYFCHGRQEEPWTALSQPIFTTDYVSKSKIKCSACPNEICTILENKTITWLASSQPPNHSHSAASRSRCSQINSYLILKDKLKNVWCCWICLLASFFPNPLLSSNRVEFCVSKN